MKYIPNAQPNLSLIHFSCPPPENHSTGPIRIDDILVGWQIHVTDEIDEATNATYAWPIGLRPTLLGNDFLCVIWDSAAVRWYNPATGELGGAGSDLFRYAQRQLDEYKGEMGIVEAG